MPVIPTKKLQRPDRIIRTAARPVKPAAAPLRSSVWYLADGSCAYGVDPVVPCAYGVDPVVPAVLAVPVGPGCGLLMEVSPLLSPYWASPALRHRRTRSVPVRPH